MCIYVKNSNGLMIFFWDSFDVSDVVDEVFFLIIIMFNLIGNFLFNCLSGFEYCYDGVRGI